MKRFSTAAAMVFMFAFSAKQYRPELRQRQPRRSSWPCRRLAAEREPIQACLVEETSGLQRAQTSHS